MGYVNIMVIYNIDGTTSEAWHSELRELMTGRAVWGVWTRRRVAGVVTWAWRCVSVLSVCACWVALLQ
eukprot:383633-Pelagomonas_calceolata.AAC.1